MARFVRLETVLGDKSLSDRIIWAVFETNEGAIVRWQATLVELGEILRQFYQNETRIYPPPRYRGGEMLVEFLLECMRSTQPIEELAVKYMIRERT